MENSRTGAAHNTAVAWTTTPANYDILVNSGSGIACRWITVGTPGTLVLTKLDGTTTTYTSAELAMNPVIYGQFTYITASGSTAQDVRVYW